MHILYIQGEESILHVHYLYRQSFITEGLGFTLILTNIIEY